MSDNNDNNLKADDNLGSFYMGRMRNPPEPRRILPKGLLTVITVFAFCAIIWYAYPQGQEKFASFNVPTIKADNSTYKFKPENPGGMEVPHQDSTVFDPIDNKSANAAAVEKLGAPPEEPMDKDAMISTAPAPTPKEMEKLNLDVQIKEQANGTEKVVPKAATPEPTLKADRVEPAAGEEEMTVAPGMKTEEPIKKEDLAKPDVKTEEAPKAAEAKPEAKPETKVAEKTEEKPAAKKPGIYIQLGSYKDLKAAKADWAKLQKKFPQSLGKMTAHMERADLGAKGVYHRLQSRAASEENAKNICKVMKASGNPGCILVR